MSQDIWKCRCGSRNVGPGNICPRCYDVRTTPAESVSPAPQPKCLHDLVDSHARCLDCGELATKAPEPVAAPQEVKRYGTWEFDSDRMTGVPAAIENKFGPFVLHSEYVSLREELDKEKESHELSRACNNSLHLLIEAVWKALEPTGEYEGDLGLTEFAKGIRIAKESAEWSRDGLLFRAEKAESQVADMRKALQTISNKACMCLSSSDENWHGEGCWKLVAIKALEVKP